MVGKSGRSGRPKGATSWWRNPETVAAQRLSVLMEFWLAGAPIRGAPGRSFAPPTERRYTVPPKIKRVLGQMAIEYVIAVKRPIAPPDLTRVLEAVRRRAPVGSKTLRRKRV
jgi:hypothetical protein